ncbi:MAG TPA: hypothetical protein VFM18_11335 [Methanosarcina sp.]|nr:hypothetical protein [Methanosarcina sp.]
MDTKIEIIKDMSSVTEMICNTDIKLLEDLCSGLPVSMDRIRTILESRKETLVRNQRIKKILETM